VKTATIREIGFDVLEDPRNEPLTTALFDRYSEQVKREIPPDRLLVFDVAESWEPLCAFLGGPVPATAFPRENASAEFQTRFGSPPGPA
jgi:hypothetical protein